MTTSGPPPSRKSDSSKRTPFRNSSGNRIITRPGAVARTWTPIHTCSDDVRLTLLTFLQLTGTTMHSQRSMIKSTNNGAFEGCITAIYGVIDVSVKLHFQSIKHTPLQRRVWAEYPALPDSDVALRTSITDASPSGGGGILTYRGILGSWAHVDTERRRVAELLVPYGLASHRLPWPGRHKAL
eukprot:1688370-Amphidinium_carterae.2